MGDMHRLLIADSTEALGKQIAKQLKDDYLVELCHNGKQVLERIHAFEPDILLLDIMLTGADSLSLLRALQTSGRKTKVIAISRVINEYTVEQLTERGVCYILTKPCAVGLVVSHIREISFRLDHPGGEDWCPENETDGILLSLNFRMGPSRYNCVFEAVLLKYRSPNIKFMKELYIDVARVCGGNYQRVEKAIRDAIEDAYESGDKLLWALYFPPDEKRDKPCPNNEDFIARIVGCLKQRARIKKPYAPSIKKAQ